MQHTTTIEVPTAVDREVAADRKVVGLVRRQPGLDKLAAFTRLAETGDIEENSVLALAIENSPWFQEQIRRAAEHAWNVGFGTGRSPFRQITENPNRPDGGHPSLPFVA